MLVRAYDDTDPRLQEEVLKKTVALAKQLDLQVIEALYYIFLRQEMEKVLYYFKVSHQLVAWIEIHIHLYRIHWFYPEKERKKGV